MIKGCKRKKKHPKKKLKKVNPEPMNDDMFNVDNEIVIGVTVLPEKDQKKNGKKKKNKKVAVRKQEYNAKNKFDVTDNETRNVRNQRRGQAKKKNVKRIPYEEERKRRQRREKQFRIVKLILKILLFVAIIVGVILFLFISPVFNIKNINVQGNNKINTEQIESLSKLNLEENIYYKIILVGDKNFEINIYNLFKYINNENIIKIKNNTKLKINLEEISKNNNLKGLFVKEILDELNKNNYNKEILEKALEIGLNIIEK